MHHLGFGLFLLFHLLCFFLFFHVFSNLLIGHVQTFHPGIQGFALLPAIDQGFFGSSAILDQELVLPFWRAMDGGHGGQGKEAIRKMPLLRIQGFILTAIPAEIPFLLWIPQAFLPRLFALFCPLLFHILPFELCKVTMKHANIDLALLFALQINLPQVTLQGLGENCDLLFTIQLLTLLQGHEFLLSQHLLDGIVHIHQQRGIIINAVNRGTGNVLVTLATFPEGHQERSHGLTFRFKLELLLLPKEGICLVQHVLLGIKTVSCNL
mmetsp:Transcript_32370/g.39801  ORF Transcript_32370/g.39801 Transcript_32370/m.39801 type:complete len:267 (-) Transcript_32370:360-1160(-)